MQNVECRMKDDKGKREGETETVKLSEVKTRGEQVFVVFSRLHVFPFSRFLVFTGVCLGCLVWLTCITAWASPSTVRFSPGDVVDVTVEGYPEYSRQLTVRQDGFINYPLVGEVRIAGETAQQVERAIADALTEKLGSTSVFVSLHRSARKSIYVWGEVRQPNRYDFETEQAYLMQALAMAGGPIHNRAKLTELQLWRNGERYKVIDLTPLIRGTAQHDVSLMPDDVVYVPSLLQQRPIAVTGAVVEQGEYEIESAEVSSEHALMMAGGPTYDVADMASAQIIRSNGERIPVNLESRTDAIRLSPGDVLHVPNAYEEKRVSVMGAVARPGQYAVKHPVSLIEALGLAGGWDEERANLKKAVILRADGSQQEFDLLEWLDHGGVGPSPVLSPGDSLRIPNRLRINWYALLTVTSTATLIYNIVR